MSDPQSNEPDTKEPQLDRRADMIIAGVVIVVGIIALVIMLILIWWERRLYHQCNDNESIYCLQFGCEQVGDRCQNNAIRYSADDNSYACSDAPDEWIPL